MLLRPTNWFLSSLKNKGSVVLCWVTTFSFTVRAISVRSIRHTGGLAWGPGWWGCCTGFSGFLTHAFFTWMSLVLVPKDVAPLLASACLAFLTALGVPLSWKKVKLGVELVWIGWRFCFHLVTSSCRVTSRRKFWKRWAHFAALDRKWTAKPLNVLLVFCYGTRGVLFTCGLGYRPSIICYIKHFAYSDHLPPVSLRCCVNC